MGCVGERIKDKEKGNGRSTKSSGSFSQLEIQLLEKMYANLAARCRNKLLTRQVFDIFFHSSGLIGQIIFLKFDSSKKGHINFDQFQKAFQIMIKGSFRERADVLFDIYDIQKTGGVNFSQLLKIVQMKLFSYPIEELNKMLLEQPFLKYIGQNQLSYYFGAEHKNIQEYNIIEESSEDEENQRKKKEDYVPASSVLYRVKTDEKQEDIKKDLHQLKKDPSILNKKISKKTSIIEKKKKGVSESSVLTIQSFKKNRKNPKIKSNIASLTKKYANFLFTSCNLDKDKDQFSKQNFFRLIQEHPAIFNVYLAGFHTYIWQTDGDQPLYMKITPYIQNYATEIYQQKSQKVYLKFIKTTVFVFDHMKAKVPKEIISLEGLNVVETLWKEQYGIVFKHRDGLYPQKYYCFDSKEIQQEWLRQTAQFRQSTLFDQFAKMERIGGGNFSNVFRGKDKKTNKQVAIKVIENFKLSSAQREVIKRECGILKNCHHPNIIKFLGEFKTKSSLYIVTELMSEGDLFDYTKKQGFLQEYEAAIIFRQLVETIIYLNHELGIIHRDLKPENIMVITSNQKKTVQKIKLIDFGFAVYKDKLNQLPLAQKYAGTPGFIAPQVYKQQPYDEKIDTFSLGIILYFMLSGYLPFQSNFIEQIADMTKNCSYSLVNIHWSNVSEDAKDIINKTLTLKDKRISANELEDHPWLQNTQRLKQYIGVNKKTKTL